MAETETEEKVTAATEKSKEEKKIKLFDGLCRCFFSFAYILLLTSVLLRQTDMSIKMMRFLLVLGIFLGVSSVYGIKRIFWRIRKIKKKNRKKVLCIAMFTISVILVLFANAAIFDSIPKIAQFSLQSNNAHAYTFTNMPMGFGERDLEKAIEKEVFKERLGNDTYDEIFRFKNGNRVFVYFQGENQVDCYEFRIEDEKYYQVGESNVIYYGFFEHHYSDMETIRSDISICINGNPFATDAVPVWGITENENVDLMKINSVGVDFVKEISDTNGGKYYFWLIQDGSSLKHEDVGDLVIEGIEKQ